MAEVGEVDGLELLLPVQRGDRGGALVGHLPQVVGVHRH